MAPAQSAGGRPASAVLTVEPGDPGGRTSHRRVRRCVPTMPRLLHLLRHGETARSIRGAYTSADDIPLTAEGERQAVAAADRLRSAGIDLVVTSPLQRARATADQVARATGAPLEVDERIVEVGYGPLEGLNRPEAEERLGEQYLRWRAQPFGGELPGMELLQDALRRAQAATADALARADRPVLVAHQGTLRLVLIALGRIEPGDYFRLQIPTAEPMPVEVDAGLAFRSRADLAGPPS